MAAIKDRVSAQFYGDNTMQTQIVEALKSAGVVVKHNSEKDYTTKKGEEGHYMSLTFTYEN